MRFADGAPETAEADAILGGTSERNLAGSSGSRSSGSRREGPPNQGGAGEGEGQYGEVSAECAGSSIG